MIYILSGNWENRGQTTVFSHPGLRPQKTVVCPRFP